MNMIALKQLGSFKNGLNFGAEAITEIGYDIIGIPDFGDNYVAPNHNLKKVNSEIVLSDYLLAEDDILFVRSNGNKALVGRTMIVKDIENPTTFSGFCIRYRPDSKKVFPLYMLYLFKSPIFRRFFANNQQTSITNLNQDVLGSILIDLPSLEKQKAIANTIHCITRQIENNNLINDNLAQQVNALYDYWFTQFDFPDENNKPYRSSGGQMVWNELLKKEIPIGWSVKPIIEFSHIYQPQTISNSLFNEEYPYYVYGGGGLIGKYNKYNHAESEIIISCRGNCGNVLISMPNSWITGNAMVVHPDETVTKRYLYEFLRSYGVEKYISGSVQKQLTRENISIMPIIVPPKPILNKFDAVASRITAKQQSLFAENQELMRLRNWILPLLMNGQATIAE